MRRLSLALTLGMIAIVGHSAGLSPAGDSSDAPAVEPADVREELQQFRFRRAPRQRFKVNDWHDRVRSVYAFSQAAASDYRIKAVRSSNAS